MGKKDLILDTMQELLAEEKGASCSVSDIAKRAGIAKGGMYYYFPSKEAVFDALVERTYGEIIQSCKTAISDSGKSPLKKLELLYRTYRGSVVSSSVDAYLHQPQNAEIHQKSLAKILTSLAPLIAEVLQEGVEKGTFCCDCPQEMSEIILSVFCFLLDPGIFDWTLEQAALKLRVLAGLIEKGIGAQAGSLSFFYQ